MAVALKNIIIVGAGIGGLCTAITLRKAGFQVSIYEQSPGFDRPGAGITLWANAVKALRILRVEETLSRSLISAMEIRTWKGDVLHRSTMQALEQKLGAPGIAIHRADLHRILLASLPAGIVQTGKALVGFEQSNQNVTAFFSDGSAVQGDLLVGCDGIHSAVRRQIFPDVRLNYAGYAAWRGVVAVRAGVSFELTSETWGKGARFGIVPIGGKKIYWFATANLPANRKSSPAERQSELLRRFSGWHAPIEALIQETDPQDILYNDIYDFNPMPRWSSGRVTLLGDAAHATTPNLGQGAGQAIESAVVLARCLAEENQLQAALSRYEAVRRPRTAWITNQSHRMGQIGQIDHPILCNLRNLAVRLIPSSRLEKILIQAVDYNV